MKKRILFVCLGNICRSPAAEAIFIHLINKKGMSDNFDVDSAGTGSWHIGKKSDLRMREAAEKRGIYIQSIARQITLNDIQSFDLIITMDSDNLNSVKALANSFDKDFGYKIIPMLSFSENSKFLDVPDPYYGGEQGFDEVLDLLFDACEGLLKSTR